MYIDYMPPVLWCSLDMRKYMKKYNFSLLRNWAYTDRRICRRKQAKRETSKEMDSDILESMNCTLGHRIIERGESSIQPSSSHGQAPRYLADLVTPAIEVASRHRLRSANRHRLIVPRCRLNTYGRRAFPVAGPTVWNTLPDELRDPACDVDSFKQFFKTILFSVY